MATISIAKGLKASFKNARDYTLSQTFMELKNYTDNYEVLNDKVNRMYGDIDGKNIDLPEEQFNALDLQTRNAIEAFLGNEPYCLLSASSYSHKKISWRFVLTKKKSSLSVNKQWVKNSIEKISLPVGITFDTSPYGKNQKIRMLGSNKDGENRPLKLVKGEVIDTLISYIPEDCQEFVIESDVKKPKVVATKKQVGGIKPSLLRRLVMNIKNDENTTWDDWYRVSQAIYNEGADLDLFLDWSSKSPKHNEREAIQHWKGLKERPGEKLMAGSIYFWSSSSDAEEHERAILECGNPNDYQVQKIYFERDHFKLKNPVCFIREVGGKIQTMNENDLKVLYRNRYCHSEEDDESCLFINKWLADPIIRTYERIVFKPGKEVEYGEYNLFTGFPTPKVQGDISVMQDLLWNLSGKNKEVFEYIENYFAHLIQKPGEKSKVCLIFSTERQGAGKDTPLDALGKIIGEDYFFNTGDAENQVFCRFNGHLQKTLLLKLEEISFDVTKKADSKLLNLITATTQSYESKGRESINLDDYKRVVMTTNKSIPVNIPESDRRFVLVNSSEDRVGDHEYWNHVYKELEKPETLQAYHYYLATKDISMWSPKNRPITDYYKEVKLALRPYHAQYFQKWMELYGEVYEVDEKSASEWMKEMAAQTKFEMNATRFGRDMKVYVESGALEKKVNKYNTSYILHKEKMHQFLNSKGWWLV